MQTNRLVTGNDPASRLIWLRAGVISAIGVLCIPLVLYAHAHLRRSEPAAHDRLTKPPTAIRLWFTERPELGFTKIRLRAPDSSEIALGNPTRLSDDPMGVSVPISAPLTQGTYTVLWRTAAADGHATSGSFSFEVVSEAVATPAADTMARPGAGHALVHVDSTAATSPSVNVSAATRWLEFMAMLAVVGAVVFRLVVLPRATRTMAGSLTEGTRVDIAASARRLAQSALILLVVTALSRLHAEARAVLGPDQPIDRAALRTLLGTSWGTGWSVGAAGIILAAIGFVLVRRARAEAGWVIAALGAAAIGIAPALTGHASTTQPVGLSIALDVGHVLAASAWLGTLLALLFAALPLVRGRLASTDVQPGPLVAALVRAFHPIALSCAAIVIATGLIAAWMRLPTIASLFESTYGRVLLLKLAFVAVVVVLGALNWRRMLPRLGDEHAARRLTRTAGAELTIAALVLAATAVLVSTSPPEPAARIAIHQPESR
jgi:copper transport protein